MAKKSCNSVSTQKGCSDNSSYGELKTAQEKMLVTLTNTETILDNFSSTLAVFCQEEQTNLLEIDSKLDEVVHINSECCNTLSLKLQQLITVIDNLGVCNDYCLLEGDIECNVTPTPLEFCVNYGAMYNWFITQDVRKISSSDDWIVPDKLICSALRDYLDPDGTYTVNSAGGDLKEMGTLHWESPNTGAINIVGFNGVGGGKRSDAGIFTAIKLNSFFLEQ